MPGVFGADLAAPVLFQAFARLKPALDPQPPAPASTLLVANADLPQPLQRFRSRSAVFEVAADAPAVAFPPDGAEVELLPAGLKVRVTGGTAPFTWLADGVPVIVRLPEIDFVDDKEGKPVGIQRQIGKRPIAAFGNSDGDFQMLEWTTAGAGARLAMIVHHDDATREFAYDRGSHIGKLERGLDEAAARGWSVISMKNDWRQVYATAP